MATLLLAASVAAAPLGCAATEAEESGELGQSSEAIIAGQEGILRASGYVPAIGLSRIYSSPGAKHSVVPGWGGCTGTLIDDHTVLTSGHCVCAPNDAACVNKNSGTITSSDPRDQFRIFVRTASGADVVYRIPVTKWALVGKEADNGAYVNDIALVRLAYRVPGALASPLTYGAWGAGDTTDYGTFGFGPGPGNGPVGVKRVGLHGGTFTYAGDQELMVGGGDSGGPTLANWSPFVGYLNTKIIAVSSAYLDNPHRVYSAAPANHAVWIEATRSGWDAAGLPLPYPFKTYIGSNLPASNTNLTAKYTIDGALFQDGFDIGGVHHAKGIFVPWDPEVRFDLSVKDLNQVNGYGTFHACVGMTDVAAHCAGASTWFLVSADGKDLTGYIEKHVGETATCFDLPVAGFDQLVLHTGSDFNECNQPAWVNAYLTNQAVPAVQGQSITWTNVFSASASGSLLSCSAGGGWSAGASSVEQIAAGDGYLAFSTAEANLSKMAGLSHGDGNQGYGDIDYAIFLRADGIVGVYEGGWDQGTFGPYMAGDSFRVEVSGGQVRYRRNGQVFYSSATPPTYPLVVDTSLEHAGATVLDARIASCVAGDTDCMPAELWTNVGYAMSSGGSLTRTPGGGWHAGASSSSAISAGDGYAQFSTAEANTSKMAGLSHGDSNRGYGDIDYAIFLRADGVLGVYEGGWDQGTFGSYAAGDVFRVEVSGGQVRYRRNGQVFHSSATPPTYPLVLDTSLEHGGATLTEAHIKSCAAGDTDCMPAELWKNVGFAMSSGGSLTRTPGAGWNAGASSAGAIGPGDGYAQFSTDEANTSKMAGLSHGDSDRGYGDIDYAIFLRDNGIVEVYEGGWYQGTFGSYAAGDVFRVEVSGGQVRYRRNGQVFYSSATPPTYPLVLDTSLYHGGATLTDAQIESCAAGDADCMPVELWKNVGFAIASGGSLTRTPGAGWNAGASSAGEIGAGDGYAQFSTDEANTSKMAGLSHGDSNRSYGDIDYAIFLRDNGVVEVYEGGWYQGTFGSYAAGDVFRVEVSSGQVRYRKNGQVFYSSATPPTYPLVLDTSLYHGGATITDALIAN